MILAVVSGFLYVSSDRAVKQRLQYIKVSNDLLAENQAKAALLPMWNIDYIGVEEILDAISETPDFINASFYDDKGYVVASTSRRIPREGEDVYHISKDIEYDYQNDKLYLGRLDMTVSLESIQLFAEEELRWAVVALLALVFILTVLLMITMHYFITNPLAKVAKTFTSIASGDMDVHIPLQARKDEIGELVRAAQVFQSKSIDLIKLERIKKEEAQVANRAKNTFLMRISHELRTPLNGILGFAAMLKENTKSTNEDYLETIQTLGRKMLSQVDDLLDFSGIENEKIKIAPSPVPWREVLLSVVEDALEDANENSNELMFFSDPDIPDEIIIDSRRIEQVMRHLTKNALKFTHDGCVVVNVEKIYHKDDDITLRFSVVDNGEGIDREFQSRMFETFSQEDESVTRRFGGIGMGLAIATGLLKLMNSQIQVESQKGEGSRFFFDVNLTVAAKESSITSLQRLHTDIWVWDISSDWREHIMEQARRLGLNSEGFDDLSMLKRRLKSFNRNHAVIVIAHPRYIIGDVVETLVELDRDENCHLVIYRNRDWTEELPINAKVIEKPISVMSIYNTVRGATESSIKAYLKSEDVSSDFMVEDMRVLVVEDDLVNQKLATTMLEKIGYNVEVANNGQEAVELYAKQPFNFILMDMMMPVMDGLQATRAIRRFRGDKGKVPIIAVTANAYESDKDECYKAGMDGYVSKPYNKKRLEGEIARVLTEAKEENRLIN